MDKAGRVERLPPPLNLSLSSDRQPAGDRRIRPLYPASRSAATAYAATGRRAGFGSHRV